MTSRHRIVAIAGSLTAIAVATTGFASTASANHLPVPIANGTYVVPFENPTNVSGSSTAVQGIKGADLLGTYYIVGTNWPNGFIYEGAINQGAITPGSGVGSWTEFNVPSSWGVQDTSPYGVANLDGVDVAIVGSWNTGTVVNSFYYQGPVTSTPKAANFTSVTAISPKNNEPADYTILHSVMGGLVVGNYDFNNDNNPAGNAFIYNPTTGAQTPITYPKHYRAFTHTAYGIWWNGGTKYTITGGQSRAHSKITKGHDGKPLGDATMIDYDSATGKFSNFKMFSYPNTHNKKHSPISHFEGIWSNGDGTYRMPSLAVTHRGVVGGIATVKRLSNGHFSNAKWRQLDVPNSKAITTNNSIYGKVSIGVSDVNGSIVPYAFRQR